jgi:hypothetical protein
VLLALCPPSFSLVAGEGRKLSVAKEIQLRKIFQPSAEKIAYILVASLANKEKRPAVIRLCMMHIG